MGNQSEKKRDAIIYVPALSREHGNDSIGAMANRLAGAFDRNAESGHTKFYVKKEAREEFREFNTRRLTIARKGDDDTPVADLYELDYRDLLFSPLENRKPVVHLLSILWSCLGMFPRLFKGIGSTRKTSLEKGQVFYGWLMAFIVSFYFVILTGAFYSVVSEGRIIFENPQQVEISQNIKSNNGGNIVGADSVNEVKAVAEDTTTSSGEPSSGFFHVVWRFLTLLPSLFVSLVVVLAGVGMFSKNDFKKMISELGKELAAAENYLSVDEKRGKIRGQFATLLEHISEKEGESFTDYENIHLVSYSFGSIIALDSLFPNDSPLVPRFKMIDTLTTIGTPYDFISTYWPEYFKNRMQYEGTPGAWINIYMKSDVFGSNFIDSKTGETSGIEFHPEYRFGMKFPKHRIQIVCRGRTDHSETTVGLTGLS
ncbi:hypothetical protein [Fodinibius halophilus]|uniref:Uncharacterized protein n=1 Tax=Fodinibius halophilus TaxID=1736908 RepID=A0A6M1T207_9BACT|nr:hypothetical protein [Fodinibius halophilus]NGP89506.1 hypothetical protein [Fodinibius halophilus]